jgi:hypothetical protein
VANGYVSTTDYDDGTPFAFAKVDCSEYQRNIRSGKWKKFENGEEPPLAKFFGKSKKFQNGEEPPLARF